MPEVDKEVEEGKWYAFFGYWWILFLVPLIAKKENKFALFHGKQGLVLFGFWLIFVFILGFIPVLNIISIFGWIIWLILTIIGMIKAVQGQYWKMPVLGDIAEKIKI